MARTALLSGLVAIGIALTVGCGPEEQVSDAEIVDALELKPSRGGSAYTIRGDPFCKVSDEFLNDADEVEGAASELVIASSDQTVGVEARPPFDPSCERPAKRGLNSLSD